MAMALITGASSGIGEEIARIHARYGGDMVVVARRADRLDALKQELESAHGVNVFVHAADLAAPGAVEALASWLKAENIPVDYLINNAGFGGHGFFHQGDWARDAQMIDLNVKALTGLTHAVLPDMVARGSGRIMNVASMAGFVPGPLQAVYYATKAYVLSLSEALANELEGTGVTVTALCPGATATEFADAADLKDSNLFKGAASAKSVAEAGYGAMLAGKVVEVPGAVNKFLVHGLPRVVPRAAIRKISRQMMEKA